MKHRINEDQIMFISRMLARHYGYNNEERACACTGLSSVCIDCPRWWGMLLRETDAESMMKVFSLAVAATRASGILG